MEKCPPPYIYVCLCVCICVCVCEGTRRECPLCAGNSNVSPLFSHIIPTFHSHNLNWQELLSSFEYMETGAQRTGFPGRTQPVCLIISRFFPLYHTVSLCGCNYSHPFHKYEFIYSASRHWKQKCQHLNNTQSTNNTWFTPKVLYANNDGIVWTGQVESAVGAHGRSSRRRGSGSLKTNIRYFSRLIKDQFTSWATGERIDRQREQAGPIFRDMHTVEILQERRPEDNVYIVNTSPLTISTISEPEVSQVHLSPWICWL